MLNRVKKMFVVSTLAACNMVFAGGTNLAAEVSGQTEECLMCHASITPGIVADWQNSRHAQVTPAEALEKDKLSRRVSAREIPDEYLNVSIGCAECHTMNPDNHPGSFDHNEYRVHTVVSPNDCVTCHPVERAQYALNIMSHAYGNLVDNPVYVSLTESINGTQHFADMKTIITPADHETNAQSCLYCHGTKIEIGGKELRETDLGEMEFAILTGWPNQGVGRINPDGSMGSCSSCHARHQFSIEMARKPYTCSECHKGPDVPAYPVYSVSKHGNIYSSAHKSWNFENVPWVLGEDFTAPTCAVCHVSLLTDGEGEVIAERTHQMNNRLSHRIFGPVYAHPHPVSPNTTIIKNKAGLPLPTELTGEPAMEFLIGPEEQAKRREQMKTVCLSCHSRQWTDNHFAGIEKTIDVTNEMTLTATNILLEAWNRGLATGLPQNGNIFDENIEKMWIEQWLFYANSTRFASAMAGADYGVFANGRWYLSKNVQLMLDWLKIRDHGGE